MITAPIAYVASCLREVHYYYSDLRVGTGGGAWNEYQRGGREEVE